MPAEPTLPADLQTSLDAVIGLLDVLTAQANEEPGSTSVQDAVEKARDAVVPVATELLLASGKSVSDHQAVIDCATNYILLSGDVRGGLRDDSAVQRWGPFVREKEEWGNGRPLTPNMVQRWSASIVHLIQEFHAGRKLRREASRAAALRNAASKAYEDLPDALTQTQRDILRALDGKVLKAEALAEQLDIDKSSMIQNHINPLKQCNRIRSDRAVGCYYRPDRPPTN